MNYEENEIFLEYAWTIQAARRTVHGICGLIIRLEKAEGSRHKTGREEGQACHDCHYFSFSASTNENSEKDETLWEYALTLLASIETVIESI